VSRWWKLASPVAVIVLWQVLSSTGALPQHTPSPAKVVAGLWELTTKGLPPGYRLPGHLFASLERVLLGFAIAALVALPLGLLVGYSKRLDVIVDPLVEALRPVPPLAWLPLAVLWFGIGLFASAFLIFLGCFFPILLSTISGVKSVDVTLVDAARTLGAKPRSIVRRVMLPGALPSAVTGLRIGMGIGWMTLVAAEMTGVKSGYGLGYLVMTTRDLARYDLLLADIVVIGLVGFLLDRIIKVAERRLLKWR
jgi:ABC-type nitrate/sulfonate/bicarbonate transport system permease component